MYPDNSTDRKRLPKVQSALSPIDRIRAGQSQKVARRRIIHRQLLIQISRASRLHSDLMAPLDQRDGVGEELLLVLRFEMHHRFPREGGDEQAHHRGEEGEKRWVREIFPMLERGPERRLVGKRRERVDVCEEVVDEQFEDREGTDGLGAEDGVRGEGGKRRGDIVWARGRGRAEGSSDGGIALEPTTLDGFSVSIWRTAAPRRSLERAWNV